MAGMGHQMMDCSSDGARQVSVIRTKKRKDATAGLIKALINRIGLASIRPGFVTQSALVLAQDVERTVGRATVHHDVFDVRIILAENALDRFLQEGSHVVRRPNDANQRQLHYLNCFVRGMPCPDWRPAGFPCGIVAGVPEEPGTPGNLPDTRHW